ncbi:unnamed protein product [Clavelina lepadiformis]|uniref:Ribosomal RNA-processing protein 43 n=1 Tax=Clavelina lepadiformis TaxID=159417 RepID=A0ABP0GZY5_CLALP
MELLNLQPVESYKTFLKENIRPDGRELMETRQTVLNVGSISTADGSALVKLGETMVICGVKAELTIPSAEDPGKGIVVPNMEMSALCSSHFKPGPPSEQAQVITKFLDNLLKSCTVIDTADLCVMKDKLVWVLYCDLICLNYDGNALDASVLALIAALQNVKIPEVTVDDESGLPHTNMEVKKAFATRGMPCATTFTVFDGSHIIADPTLKEEDITEGNITVVTDEHDNLIYVQRQGGLAMPEAEMQKCVKRAVEHGSEMRKLYLAVAS